MRSLQPPAFPDDAGSADAGLRDLLTAYAAGTAREGEVLAALQQTRLLVPIVATTTGVEHGAHGVLQEKSADMEVVLWRRPTDGRTALLGFTGLDSLRAWRVDARPSPVSVRDAAVVARSEQATALLIDVAGPVRFVVETDDLEHLAAGHILVAAGASHAWVRAQD